MAVVNITNDNFESEVLKSDKPVLVDFWATSCGPCRMQGPIVEELSNEHEDIKVGKCDTDVNSDLAEKFGIMSIPTLLAFKNGELIGKSVGVTPKEKLYAMLQG